MAEKSCPYCAETIRATAIKCRFCGSTLAPQLSAFGRDQHPGTRRRLLAAAAIGTGLVLFIAVIIGSQGNRACDGREDARKRWMNEASAEWRGFSPAEGGFRATGACSEKLVSTMLSCAESDVRGTENDSPYLHRAAELGFTIYVCELVNTNARSEYPLASIIAPR